MIILIVIIMVINNKFLCKTYRKKYINITYILHISIYSMVTKVIKRDNTQEEYDIKKIENVLSLAFKNSNTICDDIGKIVNEITTDVDSHTSDTIHIENIQNIVEKKLMACGFYDTAKHYIEYRRERQDHRNVESYISKIPDNVVTPWGMLGYITYKRTYARLLEDSGENGNTEEYRDTIMRILKASQKQLGVGFTNEELKKAYNYLMSLKCSVAGRFAWQLGTKTVDNLGIMSLQNCAFVKIDEPIKPFLWIFDVLMLGTGVGFSIEKKYVEMLPPVVDADIKITRMDTKDADFIVPDSREGWVSLLEKVLEAYFYKGKSFTYSTVLIRSAGSKIKGFGGVASGPEDLVKGLENIQKILSSRKGSKLTSVDCLDIVNIIATVVVAGNVRRCLPENSLVHTQKGLVKIQDIRVGESVLTSKGYEIIKNVFVQGKQDVIKIKTQDGDFECTPNHRMAVMRTPREYVWKKASDLECGDYLITTRKAIEGTYTKLPESEDVIVPELDEDMSWFIGVLQSKKPYYDNADDHVLTYKFYKTDANYNIIMKMKQILLKFYDFSSQSMSIDIELMNDNYYISFECHEIYDYLKKQIIDVIDIPEFILEAKFENRLAYIAGVIDGNDNTESYTSFRSPLNIFSGDCSTNEYCRQLQTVCYSCGFETKKYDNYDGFMVNVVTNHATECIMESASLIKREIVQSYINKLVQFSNSYPVKSLTNDKIYNNISNKLGLDHKYNICVDAFEKYFGNIDYCPTKVIRVDLENTREVNTYDIEVSNHHEFYCNGYLTHNSALIALGDCDDIAYLKAKDWSSGNIPNWRCMSNNSVVCNDITKLPDEFWEGYNGTSEPYGLVNLELSRKIGRIKDGDKYPDPDVVGYNPCAEQSLANFETCCLSEIYLSNVTSFDELKEIATIVYRICKHSLRLKCHQEETEKIVHKNMRMGIGITGYMQATEEQKSWLDPLYEYLREYDNEYSDKHGFPRSVKLTTVKPSGTLSLLAGVTSGCHPAIYQYFIRRIRIASNNSLIQLCKSKGYHVEYQRNFDGTDDKNTMVVEFPCCYPIGSKLAKDMTVIDQLEVVKHLQTFWSDNSVSCTVYYRLNEIEIMKEWLKNNYTNGVKTCSFLLHNDHGFQQAPFEEITKEKYEELMKNVVPITSSSINIDQTPDYSAECAGGACPIR